MTQDRFAVGRYEPKIDANQDWTLTGHMEKGGRTVMEFSRDMTTCDKRDIDITVSGTWHNTHVVYEVKVAV